MILHGDCFYWLEKLANQGVKVDMILTDPPYGQTNAEWDKSLDTNKMWACLDKICKPNTCIALWGTEPFASKLRLSNPNYKYDWYWKKNKPSNFFNANRQPLRSIENLMIFYAKQCIYKPIKTFGHRRKIVKAEHKNKCIQKGLYNNSISVDYDSTERFPINILEFKVIPNKQKKHSSEKPVDMSEYLIKTYTNKGDIVLDFTMGTGGVGVACKNTNRRFIGIELSLNYFNIALHKEESLQL